MGLFNWKSIVGVYAFFFHTPHPLVPLVQLLMFFTGLTKESMRIPFDRQLNFMLYPLFSFFRGVRGVTIGCNAQIFVKSQRSVDAHIAQREI